MSNVYYLPVPAASAIDVVGPLPRPRPTFGQALRRAVSRLRFAWREFREAVGASAPAYLVLEAAPASPDARQRALLAEHAALLGAHVARPIVPARVFDFEAARARRAAL